MAMSRETGGLGKGIGMSIPGRGATKTTSSNVRVRSLKEKKTKPQERVNAIEDAITKQTKSGKIAKQTAAARQREINATKVKGRSSNLVKINSNPVKNKTAVKKTAKKK